METVTDFIFWDYKITGDGDCSHEIRRCLLLGRKAITNLDSILKSRDITLPTKVHLVKAMVFPVVMYGGKICLICSLKYALLSAGGVDSSGTACLQFELSRGHFRLRDGAAGADGVHPGGRVYS